MKKLTTTSLVALTIFIFFSCHKDPKNYTLEDVSSTEIDSFYIENDTSKNKLVPFAKGETWKMWEDLHLQCMKSEWIRNPFYFGVTNTMKLGTISDKRYKTAFNAFEGVFSDAEIDSLIDKGSPASCAYIQSISFNLKAELKMQFQGESQELSAIFQTGKDRNIKLDGWQVQNLYTDRLKAKLEQSKSPAVRAYSDRLFDRKSRLLNKVVKVNGFTSEIKSEKLISADLKLKLEEGVIGKIGNTGLDVKVEYKDSLTIRIVSLSDFYVFGTWIKPKRL